MQTTVFIFPGTGRLGEVRVGEVRVGESGLIRSLGGPWETRGARALVGPTSVTLETLP